MAYNSKHYQANKSEYLTRSAISRAAKSLWYNELKNAPCTDCGIKFHPVAMEWDHLPQYVKIANLSQMLRTSSRKKILNEIAKCELVCKNCHAVRTWQRQCRIV